MAFNPAAATAAYLKTIPADVQARSIAYTEGGYWLLVWGLLMSALVTWLVLRSGILLNVRNRIEQKRPRPVLAALIVAASYNILNFLLSLPWNVYSQWARERSYGLNKQPFIDWLGQQGISFALSIIFGSLFFMGLYTLIRRYPQRWWLIGAAFSSVLIFIIIVISPVLVEPLFNKYKAFPQGQIRDAIVALAKDSNIASNRIFVYDGSRQRNVVTANVAGAYGTMRIAVSDIAIERATRAEVRAVVGHEIGHYVLKHSLRGAAFFALMIMLAFYLVDRFFERGLKCFGARGINGISDPAGLPVLMFLIGLLFFAAMPLLNSYTRWGEIEADQYSLEHARDPDGLSAVLIKTVEYRKASPGKFEEIIFHDHPGVENRVRMAMDWKAKHQSR